MKVRDKAKACKEQVSHHQQCLGKGSRRQNEESHLPVNNGCSDSGCVGCWRKQRRCGCCGDCSILWSVWKLWPSAQNKPFMYTKRPLPEVPGYVCWMSTEVCFMCRSCPNILILRAWRPVLTYHMISTCRESNENRQKIYKQSSGLWTLHLKAWWYGARRRKRKRKRIRQNRQRIISRLAVNE
jgi:hypothetical protein